MAERSHDVVDVDPFAAELADDPVSAWLDRMEEVGVSQVGSSSPPAPPDPEPVAEQGKELPQEYQQDVARKF